MANVLGRRILGRLLALLVFESVLIIGAMVLAVWLRFGPDAWLTLYVENGFLKAAFVAVTCQFCLYYADLYNPRVIGDRRELFVRTVQSIGATSFLLAATYYWLPQLVIGRGVILIGAF